MSFEQGELRTGNVGRLLLSVREEEEASEWSSAKGEAWVYMVRGDGHGEGIGKLWSGARGRRPTGRAIPRHGRWEWFELFIRHGPWWSAVVWLMVDMGHRMNSLWLHRDENDSNRAMSVRRGLMIRGREQMSPS